MTRVGFSNFGTPILPDENIRSLGWNGLIAISEVLWRNPFSLGFGEVTDGKISFTKENSKPILLTIQLVAFAVMLMGIATYFKPKWGAPLTLATLAPKICHRLTEIPPNKN